MAARTTSPAAVDAVSLETAHDLNQSERSWALSDVALAAGWAGFGLAICASVEGLARATLAPPLVLYWVGLLVMSVPITARLASAKPSTGERLALVCVLGMALYGVKLARDALFFTIPDEFYHAFNAQQIAVSHHLFHHNPLLPITPHYPGLEGATSALMSMTGMSSFGAGIVLIGAARLVLIIGLFVLFHRISGSARTAGLGVAIYEGGSNFLIWSAQYSYESLAVPLLVFALAALAEREAAPGRRRWAVPVVMAIAAVVITHHLTSYALAATITALSGIYMLLFGGHLRWLNPWPFALLAGGLATAWFVLSANSTADYLWPVISKSFTSIANVVAGQATARGPFQGQATAIGSPPTLARFVAVLSILILAAALFVGLRQVWDRYRTQPFALVFAAAGIGFFATLALRFAPDAWETGARAGGFLFIGLAFVAALAFRLTSRRFEDRRAGNAILMGRCIVTTCLTTVLIGGIISGWPWDAQLPKPVRATAEGRTIESEPLTLGNWVAEHLPGGGFAAPDADARTLLRPGSAGALLSTNDLYIARLLKERKLGSWELPLLRRDHLRYVVADRRELSDDNTRGYAFSLSTQRSTEHFLSKAAVDKFDRLPAARVFDSGNIVIFDTRAAK